MIEIIINLPLIFLWISNDLVTRYAHTMIVPKKSTLVPIIIAHIKYSIINKIFKNILLSFR